MATVTPARSRTRRDPPTIRGHWLKGCLPRMIQDPLALYDEARRLGDVVRLRFLPGVYGYLVLHPDAVEHVLQSNQKNYRKPDTFNKPARLVLGDSMVVTEGERWRQQRRSAQPAFQHDAIVRMSATMVELAEELAANWQAQAAGRELDIQEDMMRLALDIASRTLLGTDLGPRKQEAGQAYRTAFAFAGYKMNAGWFVPAWWPTRKQREFRKARKVIDEVIGGIIAERRREPSSPPDFLGLMLDEQRKQGGSDHQVLVDVGSMIGAGHETIGPALAWTWHLLGKHPEVQERVHDEIAGLNERLSLASLEELPLTRAVFQEALRLYPPAWGQPREAIGPDEIDGFTIPAGAQVIVSQYFTHRHPDFWDAPEEFRPERFLPENAAGRHRYAYFPFGGGARICLGYTFALAEGPLVLAALGNRFRVELVRDQPIEMDLTFSLRPRTGVRVRLWPR